MTRQFWISFKRKFFHPITITAILIGCLALILSFVIKNYDLIREYYLNPNYNAPELQSLDLNTKYRIFEEAKKQIFTAIFNFSSFILGAQWLFLYMINILPVFPVILYFEERKTGYLKSIFMRIDYKKYLLIEACNVTLIGGLIAFIPYFLYWLIGSIFIPSNLGSEFGFSFRELYNFNPFYFLHTSLYIKGYWLVFLLFVSLYGMGVSLLTFAFSNLINKKSVLYIIPLAYYYLVNVIFAYFGLEKYSVSGVLAYPAFTYSSLSNVLFPLFLIYLTAIVNIFFKGSKEHILND